MRQTGFTLWLTGLSGAGKTTVAQAVATHLQEKERMKVQLLDGDLLREVINQDLGFSREDRFRNVERAAFIAHLLNTHGVIVLASFITPYQEMRDYCRRNIADYLEVYVKCPLSHCIRRDVKGLYKRALAGEIPHFTGVNDPFEEPANPDLILETDQESPEESMKRVLSFLEQKGFLKRLRAGERG
jgi:adenylylsulfate kinase